ncbi:MAG TPA: alkyl sulfatase dimerization domain-containing protein [Ktedonobacteraceae bacterium]|nr:alkyl sulfatase dimerization domain-containing protein [Ktedonobacteraceae bacterium]
MSKQASTRRRNEPKDATQATREANRRMFATLPFENRDDFEANQRGFIATLPDATIQGAEGQPIWDLRPYHFLNSQDVPASVHPSLWRQGQLNLSNGLFQVTQRISQVRGFDLSNMTIIEGNTGLILIDPLLSAETAHAALELYYQHFPRKPVVAVIYSHSHADHFGGVKGVVSEEEVRSGKVSILAPEGFLEHAVSENIYAGNAMGRRSTYMYGPVLPRSPSGQIDAGLGKSISTGTITLIAPTEVIRTTGEKRTIDGVEILFQMAPGTEAPAEMLMYFPQMRALCAAEDMTHNLHNLYTLRGAQVRDAVAWWKTINEAIERFGDISDVVFAQHHWPTWGKENIQRFLSKQRDLYKYLHDQALRLMNHGATMLEVAEMIELPESLAQEWYNRGYYGSVSHNTKAIYQQYLGFYSSHPSDLHPLPPEDAARKYVEFMGGTAAILTKAQASFEQGEYRWVAQVMKHVVFAEPHNEQARYLLADALEQLGYQAENGTWRNEYLMGAFELRNGIPHLPQTVSSPDLLKAMTVPMYFDYLGVRLNGPHSPGKRLLLNWNFTDVKEQYTLRLENSALTYTPEKQAPEADATLTLTRETLDKINIETMTFEQAIKNGAIQIKGSTSAVNELLGLLDTFQQSFPIVTP